MTPSNSTVDFLAPLFVPGNRPDRFAKAAASGADGVILDLEDAVAANDKDAARKIIAASPLPANAVVRINAHGTHWYDDDVQAIRKLNIGSIMVPKAESADRIRTMRNALGALPVIALIESAEGLANVRDIARNVERLAFGYIDFSADVGCSMDKHALLFARTEIVLASRLAKLHMPLEGVTPSFDGPKPVEDDARYAASLGFGGKLCIHPKQIAPVLAGFRPAQIDIDWARKIASSGDGAVSVDGMMVDAPVRLRAARILAAAKACDAAQKA